MTSPLARSAGRHELHGPSVILEIDDKLPVPEEICPTVLQLLHEHLRQGWSWTGRLGHGKGPDGEGSAGARVRAIGGVAVSLYGSASIGSEVQCVGRDVRRPLLAAISE